MLKWELVIKLFTIIFSKFDFYLNILSRIVDSIFSKFHLFFNNDNSRILQLNLKLNAKIFKNVILYILWYLNMELIIWSIVNLVWFSILLIQEFFIFLLKSNVRIWWTWSSIALIKHFYIIFESNAKNILNLLAHGGENFLNSWNPHSSVINLWWF